MLWKNCILLLLFFIIFNFQAQSQRFTLGIIGGVTSSQISGDGIHGFAQFGAIAGVDVSYQINDNWSTLLGLQFNQKGSRNYQSEKVASVYRLRVNYVEAPFIFQYHIQQFKISVGFYLGAKVNQKERTSFGPIVPERPFKPLDFGGQLGVNYAINKNWEIELRFQNSLIPVRKHKMNQVYPPPLFVLGEWHQKLLNKGQYYTSLSLVARYVF